MPITYFMNEFVNQIEIIIFINRVNHLSNSLILMEISKQLNELIGNLNVLIVENRTIISII